MFKELSLLLSFVDDPRAQKPDYRRAVVEDNCLGKRSAKNRALTADHLTALYALDPHCALFRGLRWFWDRDEEGRPLMAAICALTRDSVFRSSAPFIQGFDPGSRVTREALAAFIDNLETGRFSRITLESAARNINSSWTQSGHLKGKVKKIRSRPRATPGAVSYALLPGYLEGARGESLFNTEYTRLLDLPMARAVELSAEAAGRGWILMKRIESVIEVLFPNILTNEEMEWAREQN